jgi:Predicted ATPase (AAA+ superfamily)
MNNYKKRVADRLLAKKLKSAGAVLIEGPKWCGKTTTAEQIAASILYMDEPEKKEQNLRMAEIKPSVLLTGEAPRLIDEWQIAPTLWDSIRFSIDHGDGEGRFILTGSSVPADLSKAEHSGTGRYARIKMRPMSLFESGESNGEVSIKSFFYENPGESLVAVNKLDIEDIAYLVCRGGWPRAVLQEVKDVALDQALNYYESVVKSDISRADGVNRNEQRARLLMRSYARNQGTQVSNGALKADMDANDSSTLDEDTVLSYVNALKRIFVVEDLPAWNPNLRSKTVVRTSDTRYFVDQSIAVAALGIYPKDLINDLDTFGLMFETMCIRDLRVYTDALGGQLYHYRDKNGLECDAVIHLNNGDYGLVEIKLGGDALIDHGAETLKKLAGKIDTTRIHEPSFLMVLTGTDSYAYQRKDGVYVVPVGCLRD